MQNSGGIGSSKDDTETRTFGDIAQSVVHDFQDFFRAELRLAAAEMKEKLRYYAKAGGLLAIAGLLGFFAFGCFVTSVIVALALVLPLWLAALLIGVLLAMVAGGAFLLGRMALDQVDPIPQRTVHLLRETVERIARAVK